MPSFDPNLYLQVNPEIRALAESGGAMISERDQRWWRREFGADVFSSPQGFARAHFSHAPPDRTTQGRRFQDAVRQREADRAAAARRQAEEEQRLAMQQVERQIAAQREAVQVQRDLAAQEVARIQTEEADAEQRRRRTTRAAIADQPSLFDLLGQRQMGGAQMSDTLG